MFGYVNIYKDELKVKEYNIYRSYYCGLCKTLGREFSLKTRLSLSYDCAFLSLVLSSVNDEKMVISNEKCIIHPLNKRPVLKDDQYLSYSAYMSVIVTYFKLKDDVSDLRNLKSFFAFWFFKGHLKKAKKKYPAAFLKISDYLKELQKKEMDKVGDIDEAADPFGKLLETVFIEGAENFSDSDKRALRTFAYNLGRYIYVLDALDDIEKDIKNKNYNPFLVKYGYSGEDILEFKKRVFDEYDIILTLNLESIAAAFELIDFKKNKKIVENIVYLGLRKAKDRIMKGK